METTLCVGRCSRKSPQTLQALLHRKTKKKNENKGGAARLFVSYLPSGYMYRQGLFAPHSTRRADGVLKQLPEMQTASSPEQKEAGHTQIDIAFPT